jgi:type IX secretion system PorP/SprF family membrane protein
MSYNITLTNKIGLLIVFFMALHSTVLHGQEVTTEGGSGNAYHNQLFFNRFLINPTFSLVRENKSYLNILHRNQYATFEDNSQNYFLTFSNKLNENTALGIGVYSQWAGVIQEFGFNANYATAVKLGEKSKLTFGTNVTYFNEGLDKNRIVATENDPELMEARKESKIAVQPGVTLSMGRFDFGVYAEDLFKYNQTTNSFLTSLDDKTIKASVQYTQPLGATRGLFADARIMPLLQVGKNEDNSLSYVGALLFDMPKYGWLQTTMDDKYGLSMGLGFNLNKTMSIGYLLEKDLFEEETDFGWNHEISLAYTFKNDNSENGSYVDDSQDSKIDRIIRNYEEQILKLKADKESALAANKAIDKSPAENNAKDPAKVNIDDEVIDKYSDEAVTAHLSEEYQNSLAYQNKLVLDELILRQDSIEASRNKEFEKRFETIVRFLRADIKHTIKNNLPELNEPQHTLLAANQSETTQSERKNMHVPTAGNEENISNGLNSAEKQDAQKAATKLIVAEHKDYVKLPIGVLNRSDITGVEPGYYLIANVYKNKRYLNAFINDLTEQGLNARQFYNKENGLYYVYLADFKMKDQAKTAVVSNLSGKYRDEKWIMQVATTNATAVNTYEYE